MGIGVRKQDLDSAYNPTREHGDPAGRQEITRKLPDAYFANVSVRRQQRQLLGNRLRDQDPIERILMNRFQPTQSWNVFRRSNSGLGVEQVSVHRSPLRKRSKSMG